MLPGFTAEASNYRSERHYAGGASDSVASASADAIAPAYYPGPESQARCSDCLGDCASFLVDCSAAAATPLLGCLFLPACPGAIAAAAYAQEACNTANDFCIWADCWPFHCCPKLCGIPDPLNPGQGCCDADEHCVDESDPNSQDGCCPSTQAVCGNKCCAVGDTCCGDACCPSGSVCLNGTCCPAASTSACNDGCCPGDCDQSGNCCASPSHVCGGDCCPPFNKCCNGQCCYGVAQDCHPTLGTCWNPPPPPSLCRAGWSECNGQCCPPGKKCCIPYGLPMGCYELNECPVLVPK